MQRKIAHLDMDCFYAAVEVRDNPSLQGKPVAVGGSADRRGVLCTCNYEARKFGVRSAMPTSTALRQCPNLILSPVNIPKYKEESHKIHEIFKRYTDKIEPVSLDEAYLDLTNNPQEGGSATRIVQAIRKAIFQELHLTASGGVAPNKFLAKIASDWKKPNGFYAIPPEAISEFVTQLPVQKIPGVGKVLGAKLQEKGIHTCADVVQFGRDSLVRNFGGMGFRLYDLARGIDDEPVHTQWVRKSLSTEDTFVHDIMGAEDCIQALQRIHVEFLRRLSLEAERHVVEQAHRHQIFVKIKYSDFRQTTIERSSPNLDFEPFANLFMERYGQRPRPVRLLGLGIRWPEADIQYKLDLPF